ncbi:MAG TPA: hypothetical protein VF140_09710, partial [Phycicoccus sp.]
RAGSGTRYSQLETLRSFGLEALEARGERAEADELLVAATLEVAARVADELESPREVRCAAMVREELPNIRAARRHLADHDRLDELLLLLRHLTEWARVRDANEYWSWSDDLVDRLPAGNPRRPAALAVHAQASWRRGHVAAAIARSSGSGSGAPPALATSPST